VSTDWDSLTEADLDDHTGFLLAEEAALKTYLSGHLVPTGRNRKGEVVTKEVPVYFRWPDSRTNIRFPNIMIDLLQVTPDYSRWTSEWDYGAMGSDFENWVDGSVRHDWYEPSMTNTMPVVPSTTGRIIENYLPFKLYFQISVSTNHVQTDRALTARMIVDFFPSRNFFIGIPADNTWRRCELVEWATADTQETTEATKRIFRKIYTISMEAEVPRSQIIEIAKVRRLHVDLYDRNSVDPEGHLMKEPANHAWNDVHDIAAGNFTVPPSGS
jgi:hypothetical protein